MSVTDPVPLFVRDFGSLRCASPQAFPVNSYTTLHYSYLVFAPPSGVKTSGTYDPGNLVRRSTVGVVSARHLAVPE
jgi:hypothetical protein